MTLRKLTAIGIRKMASTKAKANLKTTPTAPGFVLALGTVLIAATLICAGPSSSAEVRPVTSPDGRMRAGAVEHGERRALLTEIWLDRGDGESPRRLRTYPGAAGALEFLPDASTLVYLERSLRYPAFGSYLAGGRTLPMVNNRIWLVNVDGSEESRWPLPPELNPLGIAVSPEGNRLACRGRGRARAMDGGPNGKGNATLEPQDDRRRAVVCRRRESLFRRERHDV